MYCHPDPVAVLNGSNGGLTGGSGRMCVQVLAVDDTEMPAGHQWAVVTIGDDVLLLVRRSTNERSGIDHRALNEALAKAG